MYDDYKNVNVTWNNQPRSVSGYTSVTVGNIGWYTWDLRKWKGMARPVSKAMRNLPGKQQ